MDSIEPWEPPGRTTIKDTKGHTLYLCFRCGTLHDIFSGDMINLRWRLCHGCRREVMEQACKNIEALDAGHTPFARRNSQLKGRGER